jgi:hypothetical protein
LTVTIPTFGTSESVRRDSTLQILPELFLHIDGKPALVFLARLSDERLEMLRDNLVEDTIFRFVALVASTRVAGATFEYCLLAHETCTCANAIP